MNEEERKMREDRCSDQFTKVCVLKVLTKGDIGFMG